MGILDYFFKNESLYDPEIINKQKPFKIDDEIDSEVIEIDPNKPRPEYKDLPPVIFGNG